MVVCVQYISLLMGLAKKNSLTKYWLSSCLCPIVIKILLVGSGEQHMGTRLIALKVLLIGDGLCAIGRLSGERIDEK